MNEQSHRLKATKAHRKKAAAARVMRVARHHVLYNHTLEVYLALHKWEGKPRTKFHVRDVPALPCQPWVRAN